MKRLFAVASVMLLSFAVFFVSASAGAGPVTVALHGTWSGFGYNVGQGSCPEGYLETIAIGKGVMNLTGASQWFSLGCTDPQAGSTEGNAVITAVNGDALYMMFTIQLIPDFEGAVSGTWIQDEVIIGGSGRFAGATGSGKSSGTYEFIGPVMDVWAGTNEGEITF